MYKGYYESPIGLLEIICNDKEVISIYSIIKFEKENPNLVCQKAKEELKRYFDGEIREFKMPIKLSGTEFQNKVWRELLKIPFEKIISYQELAILCGKPKAVRAVANAVGANKLLVVVPCHRIIGSNKTLTGFAAGLEAKVKLLNLEGFQIEIKKDLRRSIVFV